MDQPIVLTSVHNPQVKRVRRLHEARQRREDGLFILEGAKLLAEAQRSGWEIVALYATASWQDADAPATSPAGSDAAVLPAPVRVADHVLAAMSALETPEGVLALARLPRPSGLPEIQPTSLWVACDRLQDPGNLGTILRTADAAGASAVLVGPGTTDAFGPKVTRASMGSSLHLPIVPFTDLVALRRATQAGGMRWAAAVPRSGQALYDADLTGPLCWWIGNEARGLSPDLLALADLQLEIPMPGRAESLNAASAAAVCLFETVRQRRAASLQA